MDESNQPGTSGEPEEPATEQFDPTQTFGPGEHPGGQGPGAVPEEPSPWMPPPPATWEQPSRGWQAPGGPTPGWQQGAGAQGPGWQPPPPPAPGWQQGQGQQNPGWQHGQEWQQGSGWQQGGWSPTPPPPTGWGYGTPGASGSGPGGPGGSWGGYQGGWQGGWNGPWGAPERQPRQRQTLPGAIIALLLVVAVLVGLGIGHGVWKASNVTPNGSGPVVNPFGNGNGGGTNGNGGGSGATNPGNAAAIAAKVSPAIVDINTSLGYQHDAAAGTGIVITSDGVVLTNNHVISGATTITATDIGNGNKYTADVVGYDRTHDIAVLQLRNASGLQTAAIGNSDKVGVGDYIVGLGNAGGVGGPPSSAEGAVTALNQSITASDEGNGTTEQLTNLIQTNANIQPGDSGGPLVDRNGKVIGIDTAASAGFSFQTQGNQGFSIPINQAMSIAGQIRSGQASSTVHIGPTAFLGVLVDTTAGSSGATLSGVVSGGPAAQAGLQSGDTIVALGGKTVDTPNTLTGLIGQYHPGDKVSIGYVDANGDTHQSTVQLGTGPAA